MARVIKLEHRTQYLEASLTPARLKRASVPSSGNYIFLLRTTECNLNSQFKTCLNSATVQWQQKLLRIKPTPEDSWPIWYHRSQNCATHPHTAWPLFREMLNPRAWAPSHLFSQVLPPLQSPLPSHATRPGAKHGGFTENAAWAISPERCSAFLKMMPKAGTSSIFLQSLACPLCQGPLLSFRFGLSLCKKKQHSLIPQLYT